MRPSCVSELDVTNTIKVRYGAYLENDIKSVILVDDDDEDDDRPAPPDPIDGPAAEPDSQQRMQAPREEHGRGGDEPEQPQVALRVGPRVRVDDRLSIGFGRDAAQAHRLGAGPPAADDIWIGCHGSSPAFSGAGIKRCRRASGRIPALPAYETPCLIAT